MPRRTVTVLSDDYDGKDLPEDTSPVRLSVGGSTYNLYLSDDNAGKLYDALEPFTKDAEKVGGSTSSAASSSGTRLRLSPDASKKFKSAMDEHKKAKAEQRDDIREWAKGSKDFKDAKIGKQGVIAAALLEAFYKDNPEQTPFYGPDAVAEPDRHTFLA